MRKKFLSAFMLGLLALGTTSTMVSCKDYDDDISSLKSQIKSLEDLIAQKEATINSSIANLQSAIDKANNDHATKAALQEAVTTLENAIKSETADRVAKDAELSAAIAKAQGAADAAAKLAEENKNSIQKVADDLASAVKNLNTLSEKLTKAEGEIGELKAALEAQIAACDKANEDLKKDLADLKKYVDDQDKALKEALQAEIQAVSDKEAADYAELKGLHEENATNITANTEAIKKLLEVTIPELEKKWGDALKTLETALAKDLTSLVYIPNLYVDGIETIEYPFIKDTVLTQTPKLTIERTRKVTVDGRVEDRIQTISDFNDWVIPTPKNITRDEFIYGPAIGVEYHANPAFANVSYDQVKGYTCRRVDVVTRGIDNTLIITSPELKDNDDKLFGLNKGILTAGLKIKNPKQLIYNWPTAWTDAEEDGLHGYNGITESQTGKRSDGKENIIALQVAKKKLDDATNDEKLITSDYAMLQPHVIHPEAIVWVKDNARGKVGEVDENVSHSWHWPVYTPWAPGQKGNAGVPCPTADKKTYHVWDTPEEALTHTQGVRTGATISPDDYGTPDLLLPWNDDNGIVISDYIGTHVLNVCPLFKESNREHNWMKTWKFYEENEWGLKYIFELVDYTIDGNSTIDSHYSSWGDEFKTKDGIFVSETGNLIARDVDANGNAIKNQPAKNNNNSVVGREPLVRVRLVDLETFKAVKNGEKPLSEVKTLLDAYILVRISQEITRPTEEIAYHSYEHKFDLCNATSFDRTEWAEFDTKVLDKLNISKENFDKEYKLAVRDDWGTLEQYDDPNNGGTIYCAKVYRKENGKFVEDKYTDYNGSKDVCGTHTPHVTWFGNVFYYHNKAAVNNHAFKPNYTEDEIEYMTHDKELPYTKEVYVRYEAVDPHAQYKYVYLKFDIKFTRETPETGIKSKDANYWFQLNGDKDGWDAVAINITEPNDLVNLKGEDWYNGAGFYTDFLANCGAGDSKFGNHVDFTNEKLAKIDAYKTGTLSKNGIPLEQYRKFFFAPINTEITDACVTVNGHPAKWVITANSGAAIDNQDGKGNGRWNAFVCAGSICCSEDHVEPLTPKGYDHNTFKYDNEYVGYEKDLSKALGFDSKVYNQGGLKNMSEYRGVGKDGGYVAGCTDNLHKDKKYITHTFVTETREYTDQWGNTVKYLASNDKKNSEIMQKCAIDYNDGMFTNKYLYAYDGKTYTPIAEMNQENGRVKLIRSSYIPKTVMDYVINAVGYDDFCEGYEDNNHKHISRELHTWVGVVANNGCGVAMDLFKTTNAENYSIFEASWERPINMKHATDEVWDADNNGDGISLLDLIKLYDWRGPKWGDMEGKNKWLWAYYNVHQIRVDLNPAHVKTTLHNESLNKPNASDFTAADYAKWPALSEISELVHLWAATDYNVISRTYTINSDPYAYVSPVIDLTKVSVEHAGSAINAWCELHKDLYGYIYYENNSHNVSTFYVRIPVEVYYEWGHLCDYITVKIHATEGNENATAKRN